MSETQLRRDVNGCYYYAEVPDEEVQEVKPVKIKPPIKAEVANATPGKRRNN